MLKQDHIQAPVNVDQYFLSLQNGTKILLSKKHYSYTAMVKLLAQFRIVLDLEFPLKKIYTEHNL